MKQKSQNKRRTKLVEQFIFGGRVLMFFLAKTAWEASTYSFFQDRPEDR
jgi:hypothetical protein